MNTKRFARLTAILLAIVLVLSFAGCKSDDTAKDLAEGKAPAISQTVTQAEPKSTKSAKATKAKKVKNVKKVPSSSTAKKTKAETTSEPKTTARKTATTKKTTTARKTTAPTTRRGSLIADAYDLSANAARQLLNGTVDFGSGGLQYLNPRDTGISVRVRSKQSPSGGVQLYLIVQNNTGRPIRLNGYSKFAIRDILGNELLSTNIRLNKPIVMDNKEEQILSITLPREWYAFDDLYRLTVEAGIFQSLIALDYDYL